MTKRTDRLKGFFAAAAAACAILPTAAAASAQSDALADCLYQNASVKDRDVLVQWAFVALGKTKPAQAVTVIPQAKIRSTETAAQKALANLVMKRCAKPAMALVVTDPKNGLQDTLETLAWKLAKREADRRQSPILSLTITDLISPR